MVLSGKEVASQLYETLISESASFIERYKVRPTLAVVLVGDDPASHTYVANKGKACDKVGFLHNDYRLPAETSETELLNLITYLNNDNDVDGILVQLPLPNHLDSKKILDFIDPDKDVDGLTTVNLGSLLTEQNNMVPCTPQGILHILDYYDLPTQGKHVVVIGRSTIVGKSIAALLSQKGRDATVTICHSKTENLKAITTQADILIVAVGKAHCVDETMVKEGSVIIDVGINRIDDPTKKRGYAVVGDVDYKEVESKVKAITPVPGGVGVMTIATLMANTLKAAQKRVKGV